MVANNVLQAQLLISRHHFKEAEELLRLELSQNIENAMAFSMLALALTAQERTSEALPAVRRAISLEPDVCTHFYVHSVVLTQLKKYEDAIREVQTAIRLDPLDADYHGHLSTLYLALKEWKMALAAAEKGLELEPEHVDCANNRAFALTHMGRKEEAAKSIDGILRRDPENADSHANQGWTYLHRGEPKQALVHFREALRLEPDMDWARQGMIEALKARNLIYRALLGYFLWISRFKGRAQWGIIIGGYLAFQFGRAIARSSPELRPWLMPVLALYIAFAFSTWVASPLFNLLLRLDPFGRAALNKRETQTANLVGLTILVALGFLISGWLLAVPVFMTASLGALAMIVPVAGLSHVHTQRSRIILGAYAVFLLIFGLGALALTLVGAADVADCYLGLFILGWALYTWVANAIMISERA